MEKICSQNLISEMKKLFFLALPLMLSEVVDASFSFTATLLSAHLGPQELAAGGLVTTLFVTIMIFMWGILISISTLISQRRGAQDDAGISRVLRDGLILAALFCIPASILVWNLSPILLSFGQKPPTVVLAKQYLHALTWAIPANFGAVVLIQFVLGLGRTRLALLFNAIKVPITLTISYVLMFGKFNFPYMQIAGLGWGITWGMWIATLTLLCYIIYDKDLRRYLFLHNNSHHKYLREIVRTGLPIAGMFCIEVGFYTVLALIMGRIDSHILAANQIAIQFNSFFTIVVAFCYAQAVSIRISHSLGRQDLSKAMLITYAGLVLSLTIMFLVAVVYWLLPKQLISLDLNIHLPQNAVIVQQATEFLMIAGFFQLCETARILFFGALRGLGETRFSMLTSLIVFWLIAFPIGIILTFVVGLGGVGMWIGMVIGAIIGAYLLHWWLQRSLKRHHLIVGSLQ